MAAAATVMEEGTVNPALSLESATAVPPAAAGAFRVTVQVLAPGPVRVAGVQVRPAGCRMGEAVTAKVLEVPLRVAVMLAVAAA